MTPEQFCYWLQGFFELKRTIDHREGATPETMKVIEDHLRLVFDKKTPQRLSREFTEEEKREWERLVKEVSKPCPGLIDRVSC